MFKNWIAFEEKYSWARYPNSENQEFKSSSFLDIVLELAT
jgi:hypothetical protein